MNSIIKDTIIFIAAIAIGMFINFAIIMLWSSLVPLPEGVVVSDAESFKANVHKFTFMHYFGALLAHGLGTLVAGWFAGRYANNKSNYYIVGIGVFFLLAGLANVLQLQAPMWFNITDLMLCYVPMALLGGWLGRR